MEAEEWREPDSEWDFVAPDERPEVRVLDDIDEILEMNVLTTTFAAERLVRVDAMRRNVLARMHPDDRSEMVERSIRLELAMALRITETAAAEMLMFAAALRERYPAALDSMAHAAITERHAKILVELLDTVPAETSARLVDRAVALAEEHPVGTFRRRLQRLVDAERAQTLEERHRVAVKERRRIIEPAHDGMGWLHILAPLVELHAIDARVTAIAKTTHGRAGEERTLDQIRTDVICDLLIDGDTTLLPAKARGIRATVAVTVPVMTLLDEAPVGGSGGAGGTSEAPCVEGIGPISVDRARELCGGSGDWMRILTHPETGAVLSVGRKSYRVPKSMRRIVRWRADRCMAPGCGVPASRCEIDHTIAWEHGGGTCLENLCPLCKGHHTLKHHSGWRLEQIEGSGGAVRWTSPSGRVYRVEPERKVPVFRVEDPPPF